MKKSLIALATLVLAVACNPEVDPFTSGVTGTITGATVAANWAEGADFGYFTGATANQQFVLASGAGTQTAKFNAAGEAKTGEEISGTVAVAPYFDKATVSYDGTEADVVLNFPATQKIAAHGQFPIAPMVAVGAAKASNLNFKLAAGAITIKLAGDNESITNVKFTAAGKETLNGSADVTVKGGEISEVEMLEDGTNTTELECGEGLAISKVAKDFSVFVPAGTYTKGFTVVVISADGTTNTVDIEGPVTVTKGKATLLATVTFSPMVDLSAAETANCYIITKGGSYCIDATTKGNGKAGIYKGFPDQDPKIAPVSASVLWEEVDGLLSNPVIKDGKLCFSCSGKDGNGVLAALDAEGNVLWSWHIWSTLQPAEIKISDELVFMDRNLGAYDKEDCGFYYEFGRKDPFSGGVGNTDTPMDPRHIVPMTITWAPVDDSAKSNYGVADMKEYNSIAFSIAHPLAYISTSSQSYSAGGTNETYSHWIHSEELAKEYPQWLWGKSWTYYAKGAGSEIEDGNGPFAAFKSVYDPCPAGYMVCTPTAIANGTPTATDKGTTLYDGKVLLPNSGFSYNVGWFGANPQMAYVWSCETSWCNSDKPVADPTIGFMLMNGDPRATWGPAQGAPVRCSKIIKFNGDKQTIE